MKRRKVVNSVTALFLSVLLVVTMLFAGIYGKNAQAAEEAVPGVTGGYDLIVTDLSWGDTAISAGTQVVFTATVKNNGDVDIPAGEIIGYQVEIDGSQANLVWCDTYSGGLKAGQSVELTCNSGSYGVNYWTASNGTHTFTAWVDDVNRFPNEVNENNNKYPISISVPYVPAATEEPTTEEPATEEPTTEEPETEESTTREAVSLPFTDVPEDYWAYSSIATCYRNGWIVGTTSTTFSPDDTITRAQFMTILGRFDKVDVSSYTSSKFTDISFSSWGYAPYVAWAEANGIAHGTDSTHFSPFSLLTRAQIIVFLSNYAKYAGVELEVVNPDITFSDYNSIPSYAREAVMEMAQAGVISGDSDKFDPNSPCSRAMVADFLVRFDKALNGSVEEPEKPTEAPPETTKEEETTKAPEPTTEAWTGEDNFVDFGEEEESTTAFSGVTGGYDLIVTDIAWGGTSISAGTNVTWTVTVKNNGDTDIPAGTIIGYQVQVDGNTSNITWCDSYSGGLKAGQSVELTCNGGSPNSYWTATSGTHSIMAWVDDVNRLPNEVDENNNQYTKTITVN